jgi:hypothetical protein
MAITSVADVFEVLGRDPLGLVGQRETVFLDFKTTTWRLEEEREQAELAKDASAMANSGVASVIVLGIDTTGPILAGGCRRTFKAYPGWSDSTEAHPGCDLGVGSSSTRRYCEATHHSRDGRQSMDGVD